MNDKLKQRLAGAAVLLVATFVVVSLLPTPEQAAHQAGVEVVTIPLHEAISAPPPPASAVLPPTLAAQDAGATVGDAGDGHDADDDDAQDPGSSGDDDAADTAAAETRKPVRLALESALKADSRNAPAAPPADAPAKPAAAPDKKPAVAPASAAADSRPTVAPAPVQRPAAPTPNDDRAVATRPPSAQSWFVQVGGFADLDNARKVQASLRAASQPNVLAPVETGKGTIYRVRAGPYASQAAAQQAFEKIKTLGYSGSQLINP